jgi:hypothetical protein
VGRLPEKGNERKHPCRQPSQNESLDQSEPWKQLDGETGENLGPTTNAIAKATSRNELLSCWLRNEVSRRRSVTVRDRCHRLMFKFQNGQYEPGIPKRDTTAAIRRGLGLRFQIYLSASLPLSMSRDPLGGFEAAGLPSRGQLSEGRKSAGRYDFFGMLARTTDGGSRKGLRRAKRRGTDGRHDRP